LKKLGEDQAQRALLLTRVLFGSAFETADKRPKPICSAAGLLPAN